MAKSKNSQMGLILKVAILVLGVAAFCMAFLTCVKYTGKISGEEYTFTGFEAMFGAVKEGQLADVKYLGFSFMNLLAFALPLVGAVLTMLNNKIAKFVGVALMVVGGILMFLVPNFAVLAKVDGELTVAAATLKNPALGIGAILGGVFSLLGGYAVLTKK